MEIETADTTDTVNITLKFDEQLVFQGLSEGEEDPEEKQTDGDDEQPSKGNKDKEESKSDDLEKGTKGKKVIGSVGPWHVPCSAAGCKACGNGEMAKPMENRILKLKATLLENFPGKAFDEGVNVAYFEGGFALTGKKGIKICAPVNTMIWHNSRKVPVVSSGSEGGNLVRNKDAPAPEFEVPIYQGYLPLSNLEKSMRDGRFIYTGKKFPKSETQNQYMLFEDLTKRLVEGCETVYIEDWNKLRSGERPFDVWNAEGMLIQQENEFLSSIQFPDGKVNDASYHAWLEKLFRLYCDIANSAQRTPSEPWTVKARFWSKDIVKNGTPEDFMVLFDSKAISDTDLKDCITDVGNALSAKASQKKPFKKPFILPDTCLLEGQSTRDNFKERFRKDIETDKLDKLEQNPEKAKETKTTITTKSISAARNYPRTSQDVVMDGESANDIAKMVWCDSKDCNGIDHQCTFSGQAEWLHRSAFSFGGLENGGGPNSSQVKGNLVLGTKETNTKMIREEEFIKRFVRKTGKCVKLTTSLEAEKGNKKLATHLNYYASLPMPINCKGEDKEKAEAAHGEVSESFYSLLERKVPTLFEVLLDVEVDKKVYRWGTGTDSEKWVYN